MKFKINKLQLEEEGYSIVNNIYSDDEINEILNYIQKESTCNSTLNKTEELFAIRQLIKTKPELLNVITTPKLVEIISTFSKDVFFLTKAIYFYKPSDSNWFVAYHQDLSIAVDQKVALENFTNWTFKKGQYGVHPPLEILQNTITIRIHLDDTNKDNGALKVIPKTHKKGVIRVDSNAWSVDNEFICEVKKGGIMLMKPLTLHASNRTSNGKRRRVIHLEFNTIKLPEPLHWSEYNELQFKQ
jgi:ectoine hydroxylase-related dioxygenase (phytanoyl-CoA dioxygenase family)